MKFGDIAKLKFDEMNSGVVYAICTWTVSSEDPDFSRGILVMRKSMVKTHLHMAGDFLEVKIPGVCGAHVVFPWLDAPIFCHRVEKTVGQIPDNIAKKILQHINRFGPKEENDKAKWPDPRFQNAAITWMNQILLGDLFQRLDNIEKEK